MIWEHMFAQNIFVFDFGQSYKYILQCF